MIAKEEYTFYVNNRNSLSLEYYRYSNTKSEKIKYNNSPRVGFKVTKCGLLDPDYGYIIRPENFENFVINLTIFGYVINGVIIKPIIFLQDKGSIYVKLFKAMDMILSKDYEEKNNLNEISENELLYSLTTNKFYIKLPLSQFISRKGDKLSIEKTHYFISFSPYYMFNSDNNVNLTYDMDALCQKYNSWLIRGTNSWVKKSKLVYVKKIADIDKKIISKKSIDYFKYISNNSFNIGDFIQQNNNSYPISSNFLKQLSLDLLKKRNTVKCEKKKIGNGRLFVDVKYNYNPGITLKVEYEIRLDNTLLPLDKNYYLRTSFGEFILLVGERIAISPIKVVKFTIEDKYYYMNGKHLSGITLIESKNGIPIKPYYYNNNYLKIDEGHLEDVEVFEFDYAVNGEKIQLYSHTPNITFSKDDLSSKEYKYISQHPNGFTY